MDKEKPTNGELYQMVSGLQKLTTEKYERLKEMADEKHNVQTGFLRDIKDSTSDMMKMVRGISIEQQNLSREFDLMVKDFELYKLSTDSKIVSHDDAINKNTKGRSFVETWYFKIVGGVTVLSSAVALGFSVAYILNQGQSRSFEDLLRGFAPAEVQQAIEVLQAGNK